MGTAAVAVSILSPVAVLVTTAGRELTTFGRHSQVTPVKTFATVDSVSSDVAEPRPSDSQDQTDSTPLDSEFAAQTELASDFPSSPELRPEVRPVSSSAPRPSSNDVSRTIGCGALRRRRPASLSTVDGVTVLDFPAPDTSTMTGARHAARGRDVPHDPAMRAPCRAPCRTLPSRTVSRVSVIGHGGSVSARTVTVPGRVPAAPAASGFADPSLSERQRAIWEGPPARRRIAPSTDGGVGTFSRVFAF
jgi:hypothetical protein